MITLTGFLQHVLTHRPSLLLELSEQSAGKQRTFVVIAGQGRVLETTNQHIQGAYLSKGGDIELLTTDKGGCNLLSLYRGRTITTKHGSQPQLRLLAHIDSLSSFFALTNGLGLYRLSFKGASQPINKVHGANLPVDWIPDGIHWLSSLNRLFVTGHVTGWGDQGEAIWQEYRRAGNKLLFLRTWPKSLALNGNLYPSKFGNYLYSVNDIGEVSRYNLSTMQYHQETSLNWPNALLYEYAPSRHSMLVMLRSAELLEYKEISVGKFHAEKIARADHIDNVMEALTNDSGNAFAIVGPNTWAIYSSTRMNDKWRLTSEGHFNKNMTILSAMSLSE